MIKVRYIRLRLDVAIADNLAERVRNLKHKQLQVADVDSSGVVLLYTNIRHLSAIEMLSDGTEKRTSIPTMERHLLRVFRAGNQLYMAILDPSRGSRIQNEVLALILPKQNYFVESLEISRDLIKKHTEIFDSAKLVSAKVRDFKISDDAVGRLEVTSKEGLEDTIASILQGKFHRIDSMTYEITHQLKKGLVTYMSTGTVRVTSPIIDVAFPEFEKVLASL